MCGVHVPLVRFCVCVDVRVSVYYLALIHYAHACVARFNSEYHDLLLGVLWESVVHPSAYVRCTSAKMFEVRGDWSVHRLETL